jgi:peptide/nickel transport system ATP-binding protein
MDIKKRIPQKPLLEVHDLRTVFFTPEGVVRAVDSLDLALYPGEIIGLVGESGSGKTVTALSLLGLIQPPGRIEQGEISFDGIDLRTLSEREWSGIRGKRIALIFQDPKVRLNPVFSIGTQIAEIIELHLKLNRQEAWQRMLEILNEVGLAGVEDRALSYPHELSVGQAQRAMIAMALALEPDLIIADEPTSSLDATIQAQILALLKSKQVENRTTILLISHNLAVMAQFAQRVVVLYAGHVLEQAPVGELFERPLHPYTQGLIASIPQKQARETRLYNIPGSMPDGRDLPTGCRFAPRCEARAAYQLTICEDVIPSLEELPGEHRIRCWLYQSQAGHIAPLDPR